MIELGIKRPITTLMLVFGILLFTSVGFLGEAMRKGFFLSRLLE